MKLSPKAKKNLEEDNQFYIDLGKKLRLARRTKINEFTGKAKFVSLQQVATALKTTYQQIGKYENAENRIPLVNLVKISKFLKKPLSYFLEDWQDNNTIADKFNSEVDVITYDEYKKRSDKYSKELKDYNL
ncbi:helix-turn-helix transcriptional regulator [Pelagibacter phage HTVC106P]|nr:helix-turn-helix transcriptional regulator [Pelagibacter phage HTVC106P]